MKVLDYIILATILVCLIGGCIDKTDPIIAFGVLSREIRNDFREGFNKNDTNTTTTVATTHNK
jgi:hypothetical protein